MSLPSTREGWRIRLHRLLRRHRPGPTQAESDRPGPHPLRPTAGAGLPPRPRLSSRRATSVWIRPSSCSVRHRATSCRVVLEEVQHRDTGHPCPDPVSSLSSGSAKKRGEDGLVLAPAPSGWPATPPGSFPRQRGDEVAAGAAGLLIEGHLPSPAGASMTFHSAAVLAVRSGRLNRLSPRRRCRGRLRTTRYPVPPGPGAASSWVCRVDSDVHHVGPAPGSRFRGHLHPLPR